MLLDNDSQIQFRLPLSLKQTLMKRAKRQGLNISALLRDAIYEFLSLHPVADMDGTKDDTTLDSTYAFRVSTDIRTRYLHACEMSGVNPPERLRQAMMQTIRDFEERRKG